MIIFKKVRYKNFLSTGQQFIEIQLDRAQSTLVVVNKKNNEMFDRLLERLYHKITVHELKILEDYSDLNANLVSDDVVEGTEDTITLVNNYVDQLPVDLDKDKLKNMIKETFVEAQDTDVTSDNI